MKAIFLTVFLALCFFVNGQNNQIELNIDVLKPVLRGVSIGFTITPKDIHQYGAFTEYINRSDFEEQYKLFRLTAFQHWRLYRATKGNITYHVYIGTFLSYDRENKDIGQVFELQKTSLSPGLLYGFKTERGLLFGEFVIGAGRNLYEVNTKHPEGSRFLPRRNEGFEHFNFIFRVCLGIRLNAKE